MTQKELKEKYKVFLEEYWQDEKMVKYCLGEISYIVELSDGSILPLDKPRLKTDFCFGYGYCGVSTEEDVQRAGRMADHAKTNENYFREKNMEEINEKLKAIQKDYIAVFTYNAYYEQPSDNLRNYCIFKDYDLENNLNFKSLKESKRLEQEDVNRIINGLEEVKRLCEKRINTYLKRYGLSKVRSWSYLSD